MRLEIRHTTRYAFAEPVAHGLQRLRLKPKGTHGQTLVDWRMDLTGAVPQVEYEDPNTNATALISIEPGARALVVACAATVDTADNAGITGPHAGHMPLWCFLRQTPLTKPGARMRALVDGLDADRAQAVEVLHALSRAVAGQVRYERGATDARTRGEDALAAGRGVCQDHTHIFIGAARLLDVPARYVSGYLKMDATDEQDAGHGWAEAHVDGLGWVGFDVANGISPDARYVRVATGRDYADAAPLTGVAQGAGETTMTVEVTVSAAGGARQQQQQQDASVADERP